MPKTPIPQDSSPAHTFASMAAALGSPDPGDEEAILEGADDTDLVAMGKQIATRHILSDQKRIYSTAYDVWTNATAEQKAKLRAFSSELLAVAVALAAEPQDHHVRADSKTWPAPRARPSLPALRRSPGTRPPGGRRGSQASYCRSWDGLSRLHECGRPPLHDNRPRPCRALNLDTPALSLAARGSARAHNDVARRF